ncbi:hypothetical protein HGA13_14540 [Nocardia speluncae]|uniref:Protein RecA n=1 Tax=Nocardia speluncae TaxID=419477 RepID=A0A846XHZ5_9NOCA|nr:hypothetical protein [Nocardia speluncae]NKY34286.1 hypothetical protein [Nocardia speluncae]
MKTRDPEGPEPAAPEAAQVNTARPPKASGARLRELAELRRARANSGCARGPGPAPRGATGNRAPVAPASTVEREILPVPAALAPLLPDHGLVKGSVVSYSGAGTLLAGLLAAVTGPGRHAAAVGLPRLGLLAAAEMGARLDRLAVIADAGQDPIEVAAVLLDGMELVVLGLGPAAIQPARARVLAAKARGKGATLLVTGGNWPAPDLSLESRVAGYTGLGTGSGRIRSISLDIEVRTRAGAPRRGRLAARPLGGRVEWIGLDEIATTHTSEQLETTGQEDFVAS